MLPLSSHMIPLSRQMVPLSHREMAGVRGKCFRLTILLPDVALTPCPSPGGRREAGNPARLPLLPLAARGRGRVCSTSGTTGSSC